jgi:hypothetical protein
LRFISQEKLRRCVLVLSALSRIAAKKPNSPIVGGKIHCMNTVEDIQRRIIELEIEHRDLDHAIDALNQDIRHDELQLRRLKKRKLQLKDHITLLKMQLVPDVPA